MSPNSGRTCQYFPIGEYPVDSCPVLYLEAVCYCVKCEPAKVHMISEKHVWMSYLYI